MTNISSISRRSKVVSVSLAPEDYALLERLRKQKRKTRSELLAGLIRRYGERKMWVDIYAKGEETAKKFKITSEEDVLRLIND